MTTFKELEEMVYQKQPKCSECGSTDIQCDSAAVVWKDGQFVATELWGEWWCESCGDSTDPVPEPVL